MTTLDDLVQLVELHPNNPIVTGMLYDHLYGEVGMTHSEAQSRVAVVVRTAVAARQIREATALLAASAPRRGHVLRMIYSHYGIAAGEYPTVVVVAGDQGHVSRHPGPAAADPYWGDTVIAVGAQWLLSRWNEYVRTLPTWRARRARPRRPR